MPLLRMTDEEMMEMRPRQRRLGQSTFQDTLRELEAREDFRLFRELGGQFTISRSPAERSLGFTAELTAADGLRYHCSCYATDEELESAMDAQQVVVTMVMWSVSRVLDASRGQAPRYRDTPNAGRWQMDTEPPGFRGGYVYNNHQYRGGMDWGYAGPPAAEPPQPHDYEAERARRARAHGRSMDLLMEFLSREQAEQLQAHDWFMVRSQHNHLYRIRQDLTVNVDLISPHGHVECRYCLVSADKSVPLGDQMLMQKTMLELKEDEFLRIANRFDGDPTSEVNVAEFQRMVQQFNASLGEAAQAFNQAMTDVAAATQAVAEAQRAVFQQQYADNLRQLQLEYQREMERHFIEGERENRGAWVAGYTGLDGRMVSS